MIESNTEYFTILHLYNRILNFLQYSTKYQVNIQHEQRANGSACPRLQKQSHEIKLGNSHITGTLEMFQTSWLYFFCHNEF